VQTPLLLIIHLASIALLAGGTAALLVMRSTGRALAHDQQVALWALLRAVGLRVQLLGLLGTFASGLGLLFWRPPEPGTYWLEAKIALAMVAGVLAHFDAHQVTRALRAPSDSRPQTGVYALVTLVLVLAALVLVVLRPF
jgi:hypothetical protein